MLLKYKFAVCYENERGAPGYITEKIFDCFFSGCVPIYLGAPNVKDFIPEDTFVDKNKFINYEELYAFVNKMDDKKFNDYQQNVERYIKSDKIRLFSAENFANTVVNNIVTK